MASLSIPNLGPNLEVGVDFQHQQLLARIRQGSQGPISESARLRALLRLIVPHDKDRVTGVVVQELRVLPLSVVSFR